MIRAYHAQCVRTTAMMTLTIPVPRIPVRNIARMIVGKVRNVSHRRISTESTMPPHSAATHPTAVLATRIIARMTETAPSDVRAPNARRERTSRPRWSVPSQWSALGPSSLRSRCVSMGSPEPTSGAKSASPAMNARITAAIMTSGCRKNVIVVPRFRSEAADRATRRGYRRRACRARTRPS